MVPKLSPLIAALRTLVWMEQNNASVVSLEQAAEGFEHELRKFIRREMVSQIPPGQTLTSA